MCRLQRSYMKYGPGGADPQAGGASRLRRVGSFRPAWGGLLTLGEDGPADVAIPHPSRFGTRRPRRAAMRRHGPAGPVWPQGCPGPAKGPLPHCPGSLSPRPRPCALPPLVYLHPRSSTTRILGDGTWGRRAVGGGGEHRRANENKSFAGGVTEGQNEGGGTRGGDPWQTKPFFLECAGEGV